MYIVSFFFSMTLTWGFSYTRPMFSEWSISAAITSWKDFRTIAPTYFVMGNAFPIDLRVFKYCIDRFKCVKVITRPLHNDEFSEILFILLDLYGWISMDFGIIFT